MIDDRDQPRPEITDEIARDMGYPNAVLFEMDVELAELAGLYNATRDPDILKQHEALYNKMLEMGMTPLMFGADTEILREEHRSRQLADD